MMFSVTVFQVSPVPTNVFFFVAYFPVVLTSFTPVSFTALMVTLLFKLFKLSFILAQILALVPKIARDKRGSDQPRAVPQSIARKVVEDKVAILSDNAGEDSRFGGQSILIVDKNLKVLARLADRHYVLERGRVRWSGDSGALGGDYETIRRFVGL